MSSIQPKGESLRRAVGYISDQLREDASQPLFALVEEASRRFDLTPHESEYLIRFYREIRERESSG